MHNPKIKKKTKSRRILEKMKEEKVQMDETVQSDSNSNDCYKQFEPHLNKINNNPMPSRKMEDDKELLLLMDESRDLSQNFHINYSPKRTRMKKHSVITMLTRVVVLIACSFSLFVNGQGGPPPPPSSPGFLDFDNLPVTRFSCEGKVIGGYYADVETGCQMFHVCTLGQKDEIQDIKFLCLNGTVFDQETRVCERVEEVDCSKAEQFYDLNLDLYVPHPATPKLPQQDLEEEDDFINPVSTQRPPSTTTTQRPSSTQTTPTPTPRHRISGHLTSTAPKKDDESSNSKQGFSSFNYYLQTPHSHIASGYNSQSQQSYVINHSPGPGTGAGNGEDKGDEVVRYASGESTGRKIPVGPKNIIYTVSSSSTTRPLTRASTTTTPAPRTTKAPVVLKPEDYEEQYTDEYYDDELPIDYEVNPGTSQAIDPNKSYGRTVYQPEQSVYTRSKSNGGNSYNNDYRDGRSASVSTFKSDRNSTPIKETKSHVSVAITSSKSTRSPPIASIVKVRTVPTPTPTPSQRSRTVITTTTTTRKPTLRTTTTTTPEPEPYYYDDDYPDDSELQEQEEREKHQQPMIIVKMPGKGGSSTTTLRTVSIPVPQPQARKGKLREEEYYDDTEGREQSVNENDHHFTHVDVPRIPYAKPNVPRVLVTNGKPFLPRLTRHVKANERFSRELLLHNQLANRFNLWEPILERDAIINRNYPSMS